MSTTWEVRGQKPIVYVVASCPVCKTGVLIERPVMWQETGQTLPDGEKILRPYFNPHLHLRHGGCGGRVEMVPTETLRKILERLDLKRHADELVPLES